METSYQGGAEAQYQAALNEGRFLIQHCAGCGKHVFFPRSICPHCWSEHLDWVQPTGSGTVYSTTTVRRKPEAGGNYNVALIDLDEGVRIMSRIEGLPPTDVKIGMRVWAEVVKQDDKGLVIFHPEVAK